LGRSATTTKKKMNQKPIGMSNHKIFVHSVDLCRMCQQTMVDGQVADICIVPTAWKISTREFFVKYTVYGNAV